MIRRVVRLGNLLDKRGKSAFDIRGIVLDPIHLVLERIDTQTRIGFGGWWVGSPCGSARDAGARKHSNGFNGSRALFCDLELRFREALFDTMYGISGPGTESVRRFNDGPESSFVAGFKIALGAAIALGHRSPSLSCLHSESFDGVHDFIHGCVGLCYGLDGFFHGYVGFLGGLLLLIDVEQ